MALNALEEMSGPLTLYLVVLLRQLSLCDPLQFRSGRRTVLQQDIVLPFHKFDGFRSSGRKAGHQNEVKRRD